METSRKSVIEHFKELSALTGKPLKTEVARHGERLIYGGKSVILPPRGHRTPCLDALSRELGLSAHHLTQG